MVAAVVALTLWAVMRLTGFGLRTVAIGSSREAAVRAGVAVDRHLLRLFVMMGLLVGIAGLIDVTRFATTNVSGHQTDALAAIAAVVIGGSSLSGASHPSAGPSCTLFPVTLATGLAIMRVESFYQLIAVGLILTLAVYWDQRRAPGRPERRQGRQEADPCTSTGQLFRSPRPWPSWPPRQPRRAWRSPSPQGPRPATHRSRWPSWPGRWASPSTPRLSAARTAASQFNVDLNYQGPTDWDMNKQLPFIQAGQAARPPGPADLPTDGTTLIPMIEDLTAKGVPVVTIDAPLDKPVELQSIQSNHYAGGQAAAKAMSELTGGSGTYVVVGNTPGLPDIDARVAGFVDDMTAAGATVLPVLEPGTDSTKAANMVAAAIQASPDLTGIYVTHSAAAQGASAAILEAGQQGKIKLVAFDADPQQFRDLKDGVLRRPHRTAALSDGLPVGEAGRRGAERSDRPGHGPARQPDRLRHPQP